MAEETETTPAEPVEPTLEVAPEEPKEQTESEFMEETVAGIKETQEAVQEQEGAEGAEEAKPTADTEGAEPGDDGVLTELAETEIPDAFTEAAEAAGMTEQDIIELADKHTDEQLLGLVPTLTAAMEKAATSEPEPKQEEVTPDVQQRITEQVTKQLTEQFGVSLEEMKAFKEQQAAQQNQQTLETVNRKLDDAAKEFSIFGKTEELPKFKTGALKGQLIPTAPAVQARQEVVRYADAFAKMGRTVDEAMDDALATYRGKHLQKEMERSLIKNLKQQEQQLSGGRVGKETKKKYVDSREEMIDDIRSLQQQAGIET